MRVGETREHRPVNRDPGLCDGLEDSTFALPAEWTPHRACWLAWPAHPPIWNDDLEGVREGFEALCHAIAWAPKTESWPPGEKLEMLVLGSDQEEEARRALEGLPVRFHRATYGDVWVRDTGPLFVEGPYGLRAARFQFNGWGGRYLYPGDGHVALEIARCARVPVIQWPWVLEGGALEVDGQGTGLVNRSCALHPNRFDLGEVAESHTVERRMGRALGVGRTLWIAGTLANDHTDGHVDTLVRFVGPGRVVCMRPSGRTDPNRSVLEAVMATLEGAHDVRDRPIEITTVPGPGRVVDRAGNLMPASYVNYYISNHSVVVPTYGVPQDADAVATLQALWPHRRVVGIEARAILEGGGAFHCITQQEPIGSGNPRLGDDPDL